MAEQLVARVGDTGHGVCHAHSSPQNFTTTFTLTGADPNWFADGEHVCLVGVIGLTTCGHHTVADIGSNVVFGTGGLAVHRVGDGGYVQESPESRYVVDTGSSDVKAN